MMNSEVISLTYPAEDQSNCLERDLIIGKEPVNETVRLLFAAKPWLIDTGLEKLRGKEARRRVGILFAYVSDNQSWGTVFTWNVCTWPFISIAMRSWFFLMSATSAESTSVQTRLFGSLVRFFVLVMDKTRSNLSTDLWGNNWWS